jgi:arylsulfatase A-like enzyme
MKNWLVTICCLVLLTAAMVRAADAPRGPNIVFILADDFGWHDTSLYGSTFHRTPNIDKLAARGMMFTQAYAANPLCSPTRSSILTGLYPARIGITAPVCHMPEEFLEEAIVQRGAPQNKALQAKSATRLKLEYRTIAESLKDAGYVTGHFGKWHLGLEPYDPLHQGFDVDVPHWPGPGPAGSYVAPWKFPLKLNFTGQPGEHIEDRMSQEAVKFIRQNKDRPFFLNYWAFSVHAPFDAKKALIEKYAKLADPKNPQRNPLYAAMVESLDDAVGTLVKTIDELGLTQNTIIVFFSDNGGVHWTAFKEHGDQSPWKDIPITSNAPLRGGKATIYEGGTREPCIWIWPGVTKAGSKSDALISSIDFHPTLLEMVGLKPQVDQKFDGMSIVPALKGQPLGRDTVFCHFPHYTPATGAIPSTYVRKGDWKLIRCYADNDDQTDRFELYNLKDDLSETKNLAPQMPEKVMELNLLIEQFLKETMAVVPTANPAYRKGAETQPAAANSGVKINGWAARGDAGVRMSDGQLVIACTGKDPGVYVMDLKLPKGPYTIDMKMKSNSAGAGQIFWSTTPKLNFSRGGRVDFPINHDSQWHEYQVKMPVDQAANAFRVDPGNAPGEVRIEWIRLSTAKGELVRQWRFLP